MGPASGTMEPLLEFELLRVGPGKSSELLALAVLLVLASLRRRSGSLPELTSRRQRGQLSGKPGCPWTSILSL